jgi:hypothetical protein
MNRYYWIPSAVLFTLILLLYVQTRLIAPNRGDDSAGAAMWMPTPRSVAEQQELYLTPAGLYSRADIVANGNLTAAVKYRDFRARHDFNPQPGDRLCPVTRTKADPECCWTIGGREYQFCCPPCIDEFVRLARVRPDEIQLPEDYVE